jgi:hypothetical protein
MTARRRLEFVEPDVESFCDRLEALWAEGVRSIYAVGEPQWQALLERAAQERGMVVSRELDVTAIGDVPGTKAAVFGETDGRKLGDRLLSCLALDDVVVVAPITDWHCSRKPLFLVSVPKAGTHLLYELANALGYQAGVECPEFPAGKTWYCVEYSNSHTVARDFFVDSVRRSPFGNRHHRFMRSPTLFMYRHPLDILVSEAHYYHRDGKTAFAGWLSQDGFDTRVERLCNDNWLLGSLRERIGGFLPWLRFPNVIGLSFEQLIGEQGGGSAADQRDLIWSIQLKLQAPGDVDSIAASVFNPASATFHAGRIGAYRTQLSSPMIASWCAENTDLLAELGYPADGSIGLPAHRAFQLARPVRYSSIDEDRIPVTVEADFFGCNLVRFDGLIYAIPRMAGAVSLDRLGEAERAQLPAARSVGELKSLLLLGRADLSARWQALGRLGKALQGEEAPQGFDRYWQDSAGASIVGSRNGFNLVAYRGLYFGLRQTLGAVDLTVGPEALLARFAFDDVAVSTSIPDLELQIDGLESGRRALHAATALGERTVELVSALQARVASLEDRLATYEGRLAGDEADASALGSRVAAQDDGLSVHEGRLASLEARSEQLGEQTVRIGQLEARQAALAHRCTVLGAQMEALEASWPVRFTRLVTRVLRGRT